MLFLLQIGWRAAIVFERMGWIRIKKMSKIGGTNIQLQTWKPRNPQTFDIQLVVQDCPFSVYSADSSKSLTQELPLCQYGAHHCKHHIVKKRRMLTKQNLFIFECFHSSYYNMIKQGRFISKLKGYLWHLLPSYSNTLAVDSIFYGTISCPENFWLLYFTPQPVGSWLLPNATGLETVF